MTSTAKMIKIKKQIEKLKKQKEKLQVQIALSFYKEVQKRFGEDFCPSFVLGLLKLMWTHSSEHQKQKWRKQAYASCPCSQDEDTSPVNPTPYES